MTMTLVTNVVLLAVCLLTAPAVAKPPGLRGSLSDSPAAEDDRAALRALSAGLPFFSMSMPHNPPTFPPIPVDLPPGILLATRESSVHKTRSSASHVSTETISISIITDGNSTEVGSTSTVTLEKDKADEFTLNEIEMEVEAPDEYEVYNLDMKDLHAEEHMASEVIISQFLGDQDGAEGYYYNNITSATRNATEVSVAETISDEKGPIEQYFDGTRTAGEWLGAESTNHQYGYEFAPAPAPP